MQGDKLLFEENLEEIEQGLKPHLSKDEVDKYIKYFTTWIIMELEAEKDGSYGLINAMKTLKNINTTATFGQLR